MAAKSLKIWRFTIRLKASLSFAREVAQVLPQRVM
jgi:hypothetical protein